MLCAIAAGTSGVSNASDFHSPRTAALGGAGRAGPFINDAIYLNPSFISYLTARSISLNFEKYNDGGGGGRIYNFSVQDGTAPLFQAGVGFTHRDEGSLVSIGASRSLLKRIGVGVGYKLWFTDQDPVNFPKGSDAIIAVTYIAETWLQAVLVVDNFFKAKATSQRGAHREIAIGTKINVMEMLLVYFDPHWAPDLPEGRVFGHELGVEVPALKDIFLRAGHFRNAYQPAYYGRADGMGFGFAWVAPRLSLEASMTKINGSMERVPDATIYNFGATIFF
ncbi:MAG: hypothetical protein IT285_14620 [Bdellovibrionales bacterium]|nr:hypothetical protein [Bdellovibrionales bacterium]